MERPVQFLNGSETLRGVLHGPDPGSVQGRLGVVFLHGWTGSRLGPHRMFVHTARQLAADGCYALRFDFRGRGESEGAVSDATIRTMVSDAGVAADFLRRETGADPIVLLGICSGGKVALAASVQVPAVAGTVLWSCEPMGGLRTGRMRVQKSASVLKLYARKLLRIQTWRKALTGRVNVAKVREAVLTRERPADDERTWEARCLQQVGGFRGRMLFVHGTNDPEAAPADQRYRDFCSVHGIASEHHAVEGANHSFYSIAWEEETLHATRTWLATNFVLSGSAPTF